MSVPTIEIPVWKYNALRGATTTALDEKDEQIDGLLQALDDARAYAATALDEKDEQIRSLQAERDALLAALAKAKGGE